MFRYQPVKGVVIISRTFTINGRDIHTLTGKESKSEEFWQASMYTKIIRHM